MWNRCDTCHPRGTCRCGHALLLKFPDIFQGHLHVQSVQEPTLEVTVSRAPRARKGCNWCTIRRIFPTVSTQARVHSGSKSNGHGGGGASWSIKEMGWSECSPPIAWLHPGISPQDEEFGGQRPGLPSEQSRIWIAPPHGRKRSQGGVGKATQTLGGGEVRGQLFPCRAGLPLLQLLLRIGGFPKWPSQPFSRWGERERVSREGRGCWQAARCLFLMNSGFHLLNIINSRTPQWLTCFNN